MDKVSHFLLFVLTLRGYKCKLKTGYTCRLKGAHILDLISKITDSELEVLRILWESKEELTISEIRRTLEKRSNWETSTIKTLLRRLCDKGVVLATKKEVYYYKSLVSEGEYNEYTTQRLIDHIFSGSAKNLVASLLGSKKLNKEDVEELRELFKAGESSNE